MAACNVNGTLIIWYEPSEAGLPGGFQVLDQSNLGLLKYFPTDQLRFTILTINTEGDKLFAGEENGNISIYDIRAWS